MKDFFISYNRKDTAWAEWIAVALSGAKYTLTIQAWDFLPGSNFVLEMQRATVECKRTIAVMSPDWLASVFTQPEWAAAFSLDPTGASRKLIPVRVRACEPPGLLRSIVYCDLVGLGEEEAGQTLIKAVGEAPAKPDFVPFHGASPQAQEAASPKAANVLGKAFPGSHSTLPLDRLPFLVRSAFDLLGLLRTTRTTFEAQARLRDRLVQRIHERLVLDPFQYLPYEEFFTRYFPKLDSYERQVFDTIRSFTANILRDYNRRIGATIDGCPQLMSQIRSMADLKNHLLVWLAKFEGTFLNRPEMCLLYVGVEEGMPFPSEAEAEIWSFLKQQGEANELLRAEPKPPPLFEERSSENDYWRYPLHRKWLLKQIQEIEAERVRLGGVDAGLGEGREPSPQQKNALKELDQRLAKLLAASLYSEGPLEGIVPPWTFVPLLWALVRSRDDHWPAEFLTALSACEKALEQSGYLRYRALLPLLPTLAFHVEALGLDNDLPMIWQRLRGGLKDWAIVTNTERPNETGDRG